MPKTNEQQTKLHPQYLQCLRDLLEYIDQVSEADAPPTSEEIKRDFVGMKMQGETVNTKSLLAQYLDNYIKTKHTQEECIGFIDGFEAFLHSKLK